MPGRLTGQAGVVTGGGRGIGRAYAKSLAAEGMAVVVNDNGCEMGQRGENHEPADSVVKEIKAAGGKAVASYGDVANKSDAAKIVKAAKGSFGRLDLLITNAGTYRDGFVVDLTPEDFEFTIGVHIMGSVYCSLEAIKVMRAQGGGAIINIASGSMHGTPRLATYAVGKGGAYSVMRALSLEMPQYNISVNAISPGGTRTRAMADYLHQMSVKEKAPERAKAMEPHLHDPEVLGPLAVFLASAEGRKLNGYVFSVGNNSVTILNGQTPVGTAYFTPATWNAEQFIQVLPKLIPPAARR